ncbi:MAG TPA: AMP-binding protein [Burkholderiales bacterium]|nr:AMP-binding protein [Burkholderiales bacterium]
MSALVSALAQHAADTPDACALSDGLRAVSYAELTNAIDAARHALRGSDTPVALALDNGPAWVTLDLALAGARRTCLPLPPFFSEAQKRHALRDAGAGLLLTDRPDAYEAGLREHGLHCKRLTDLVVAGIRVGRIDLTLPRATLPADTVKITYTSGTTDAPKGVCLGEAAIAAVARSLAAAVRFTPRDRHLALLPLSLLLENIAGIYAPLSAGACVLLPPLAEIGLAAGAGMSMERAAECLAKHRATTAITVPELLAGLCRAIERGAPRPGTLRFLAVGGARVPDELFRRAAAAGLPVYEGYGLTECASVVALNTPQANRPGSVGRVLPHAGVTIADGEIHVRGATFLGYTHGSPFDGDCYPTGDLGRMDDDGFLYLTGRRRNVFITSYGRNVSPEWVESELTASDAIAQAWVYGEALPWNFAVVTPREGAMPEAVEAAIAAVNLNLPDYARVKRWIRSSEPFSPRNGQLTANGRIRRSVLIKAYRHLLHELYGENPDAVLR